MEEKLVKTVSRASGFRADIYQQADGNFRVNYFDPQGNDLGSRPPKNQSVSSLQTLEQNVLVMLANLEKNSKKHETKKSA